MDRHLFGQEVFDEDDPLTAGEDVERFLQMDEVAARGGDPLGTARLVGDFE